MNTATAGWKAWSFASLWLPWRFPCVDGCVGEGKKRDMNRVSFVGLLIVLFGGQVSATSTWDGKYDTDQIEVTMVYFVPSDREPLEDWRQRIDYYGHRLEQFHAREFEGQSRLTTRIHPKPFVSGLSTRQLRVGDADQIYFRTLGEVDRRLKFAPAAKTDEKKSRVFPVLLVFSEINWRPLNDFYRIRPTETGFQFEGNYNRGQHFPGAASGGARALYNPNRGVGWGLVSADGWRVPYRGSDCVVYHEGCGHTVGLPHPEPGNGSVMSMGQYRGWLSESWLDKEQKSRLGWEPGTGSEIGVSDKQIELFSAFRVVPDPLVPAPGNPVRLKVDLPEDAEVESFRVRVQTSVTGPWVEVPQHWDGANPAFADLGTFDRDTPVSYRVDVKLVDGETAELWGYLQIRSDPEKAPMPPSIAGLRDLNTGALEEEQARITRLPEREVDLLQFVANDKAKVDGEVDGSLWARGDWKWESDLLVSPKQLGARLQLPYAPPSEYRLTVVVEPIDEPNGLLVGNVVGGNRFACLFSFQTPAGFASAIENIDGKNVGNETTYLGPVFRTGQVSQLVIEVRSQSVSMMVDGRQIIRWQGSSDRLSLSDYWATPAGNALFLGAYHCRYRFHRVTLEPLSGKGKKLP